jgi:hypothetical protein
MAILNKAISFMSSIKCSQRVFIQRITSNFAP